MGSSWLLGFKNGKKLQPFPTFTPQFSEQTFSQEEMRTSFRFEETAMQA
jgi:hypothetical protein